jgi:acyl dehydratase
MPLDPSIVGRVLPSRTVYVEPGRLRFFAASIAEADPLYTDLEAAKAAGHRDLPVPPTFLFCLSHEVLDPFALIHELGIDPRRVLHGEQRFTYHAMTYAGDRLTFTTTVTDVYTKKGGALEFLVQQTEVSRGHEPAAQLETTLVVRHTETGTR